MFSAAPAPPKMANQQQLAPIDDSLTDIRWLGSMNVQFPSLDQQCRMLGRQATKGRICKKLSYEKKPVTESSRTDPDNIRPPFSYAALIALAINSNPQRMLTLNSIYRWIEDNFPFFRMPEARAWKNSIRHNLSIKKNMFQKVYIDPPRRGNGAYWTLLSEGLEEVERCMKLLTTLRPPVIDPLSSYLTQGPYSNQVVRSRGKFVPSCPSELSYEVQIETPEKENTPKIADSSLGITTRLIHPLEQHHSYQQVYPPSIQPYDPSGGVKNENQIAQQCDNKNNSLFDLSFNTPLKDDSLLQNTSDFQSISLSPFLNYLTPKPTTLFQTPNKLVHSHYQSPLSTPLKPFNHIFDSDSGIYLSPAIKFSTPVKDFNNLVQCTPIKYEFQ
jgi:hypothetical protein